MGMISSIQRHDKQAATILVEGQVVRHEHAVRTCLRLVHFPFMTDESILVLHVRRTERSESVTC